MVYLIFATVSFRAYVILQHFESGSIRVLRGLWV